MNTNLRNKIKGSVYGFAIGDAMGATTEFMLKEQIEKRFGKVKNIIGGGWLNLQPGDVTDDTQMTMCVMSAIMRKPESVKEFKKYCIDNFVIWKNSKPKDIGNQCFIAINCLESGSYIPVDNQALGNGSLMRAMPCAVLNLPYFNIIQSNLTHNNDVCSKIIQSYTRLIQNYINNNYNNILLNSTEKILEPSGYIINTFNNSIYWSKEDSFEKAIIGAVNDGGDADTIAAITGSLAGAKFGYDTIPERWVNQLNPDVKEFLDKFISFVFECLQI